MAVRLSTGLRAYLQDSGLKTAFDGGTLKIYSGSQPAAADDAPSGTLLASITLPGTAFGASTNGVMAKAGTWQDASADATGTAGWFRVAHSGDSGGSSTTDRRIDGAVAASGSDLNLNTVAIVAGQQVTITTFTVTQPAS
jgi:hypothetical protein